MGDLISRSELLKRLNEYVFDAFDCDGIDGENVIEYQLTHDDNSSYIIQGFNDVYELLKDVPTAYDVEAVVKQIEELPTKKTTKMVESKEVPEWFYEVVTGEYVKKDDVVEIVRRGGVNNA